jgi:hypothetical protein
MTAMSAEEGLAEGGSGNKAKAREAGITQNETF